MYWELEVILAGIIRFVRCKKNVEMLLHNLWISAFDNSKNPFSLEYLSLIHKTTDVK